MLRLAPGKACSIISCSLHRINIDELSAEDSYGRRRYHALSYTWGTASPKFPILCNGKIVEVTRNLYEALLYLQQRKIGEIWIDAVCIDQSNIDERNAQIQHMTEIYRNTKVLIWLGAGSKAIDNAFDILDHIHNRITIFDKKADEKLILGLEDTAQEPLAELPNRPWFRRVWIIQEAMVAKSAVVYCGKRAHIWVAYDDASKGIQSLGPSF
ncbi:HET-domain-containing protein [Glonium stellatum]|uniref:HET-domain-containing protein n=1 Tax=Glonium stellatum TaxID=574774 RepID=A0A8E2JM91_9PEZI|nr:HET-domain-containing protein [Glonium stellatum]